MKAPRIFLTSIIKMCGTSCYIFILAVNNSNMKIINSYVSVINSPTVTYLNTAH